MNRIYSMNANCVLLRTEGFCVLDTVAPASGSIIVGATGSANVMLFCRLVKNGTDDLFAVSWHISDNDTVAPVTAITPTTAGYNSSGEILPGLGITSGTNLTITELTEEQDQRVLFCGRRDLLDAANFSIRIYREFDCST